MDHRPSSDICHILGSCRYPSNNTPSSWPHVQRREKNSNIQQLKNAFPSLCARKDCPQPNLRLPFSNSKQESVSVSCTIPPDIFLDRHGVAERLALATPHKMRRPKGRQAGGRGRGIPGREKGFGRAGEVLEPRMDLGYIAHPSL